AKSPPPQYLWLGAAVLCGGVLAPILLLWGLAKIPAASAALMLNLESVATTMLAAFIFAEQVGRRVWFATLLMLAAGAVLSWQPHTSIPLSIGALSIVAACVFWGLDNNFTRKISGGDAMRIAMVKGLVAGAVNVVLALAIGATFPQANHLIAALLLGAFAYGVSLVLYVRALRHLGSARTGAHFATAPFVGAAIAVAFGEHPGLIFVPALALMVIATWLLLTEHHAHRHVHEPMSHTHEHVHDEHHHHAHDPSVRSGEPHTHHHEHGALTHFHPHLPDLHHRHTH
ncbi:MAG TPA: DMT family transporter, partial [Burkholderiales bacterium]|nr:DMT family transporter [Burkholderiales bacterium]